jgi:hypothetical protein
MLDPDGKTISFKMEKAAKLEHMREWVKGLKVDHDQSLIYCWDQENVCFYQLKNTIDK